jgi:hypothetical protein
MKYSMYVEIEAEQFLPEEDKIPKGVASDGLRSPKTDPRAAWMLTNKSGGSYIKSGDYVITVADGDRYIVPKDLFEKNYKPVES